MSTDPSAPRSFVQRKQTPCIRGLQVLHVYRPQTTTTTSTVFTWRCAARVSVCLQIVCVCVCVHLLVLVPFTITKCVCVHACVWVSAALPAPFHFSGIFLLQFSGPLSRQSRHTRQHIYRADAPVAAVLCRAGHRAVADDNTDHVFCGLHWAQRQQQHR